MALVVGLNEGEMLRSCLPSLGFVQKIVYLDLGSSDESSTVAESFGAEVHSVPRRLNVETVVWENSELIDTDWVFLVDPDEQVSPELAHKLQKMFSDHERFLNQVSCISVCWRFFAHGKPLRGTPWGGVTNSRQLRSRSDQ